MKTFRISFWAALCVLFILPSACDEARTPFVIPDGVSDVSPQCSPGATQACLCGSGSSGVQSCNQSGSGWLNCECIETTPDAVVDTTPTPDAVVDTTPTPDATVDAVPDVVVAPRYHAVYIEDHWDGIGCGSAIQTRMSPGADIDAVELLDGDTILGTFDVVRGQPNPTGDTECENGFSDPSAAKGPPDATQNFENYFSLHGGWLIGEFANALEVTPGDTVKVYELGTSHPLSTEGADEPYEVWIATGLECVDDPDPQANCMVQLSAEVVGTGTVAVPAF
ncbi:MAG: hypothetical protein R3F39_03005 [Myxococcota bacterium]